MVKTPVAILVTVLLAALAPPACDDPPRYRPTDPAGGPYPCGDYIEGVVLVQLHDDVPLAAADAFVADLDLEFFYMDLGGVRADTRTTDGDPAALETAIESSPMVSGVFVSTITYPSLAYRLIVFFADGVDIATAQSFLAQYPELELAHIDKSSIAIHFDVPAGTENWWVERLKDHDIVEYAYRSPMPCPQ